MQEVTKMTINERISELIDELNIKQKDFAYKIKLKPNTLSMIRSGKRAVTDRVISDICREFNISEVWLREGLGPMRSNKPARSKILTFADYVDNLDKSSFLKLLMESVAELSDKQLEQMEEIGKSILHNIKQKESNE